MGLRDQLAAIEHERWASWQRYLHSKLVRVGECSECHEAEVLVLPRDLFERWERQISTLYSELTEAEQLSDMKEVDKYWPLIHDPLRAALDQGTQWRERGRYWTCRWCGCVGSTKEELVHAAECPLGVISQLLTP